MKKLAIIGGALLGTALFVACGGGGSDSARPDQPSGTERQEERTLDSGLRREISQTVEGFYEVFGGGAIGKLAQLWSESCDQSAVESANDSSILARVGDGYDVMIDSDSIIFEVIDSDRVTVPPPSVQPEGVIRARTAGRFLEPEEAVPMGMEDTPLELAREDVELVGEGVWRVMNCADFTVECPSNFSRELGLTGTPTKCVLP